MKKLAAILMLFLSCSLYSFAQIGAASIWDVKPATGSNTYGGFFDGSVASPGTDESQGTGTAITCTLASSTTATCSPALTSTTHGPGNSFKAASGSGCNTTNRFELSSQTAGLGTFVGTGSATLGTTGDVCVGRIGGALASISYLWGLDASGGTAGMANANVAYFQCATETETSTQVLPGTSTSLIGYSSVHGDNGCSGTMTTATNSTDLIHSQSGTYIYLQNMNFSNTAGTSAFGLACLNECNITTFNTSWTGFTKGIDCDNVGAEDPCQAAQIYYSTFTNNTTYAVGLYCVSGITFIGNYLNGNATTGFGSLTGAVALETTQDINASGNVAYGQTGTGPAINVNSGSFSFIGNALDGNAADGASIEYNNSGIIANNWGYGNGGWFIDTTTSPPYTFLPILNNGFGSNTSGNIKFGNGTSSVSLSHNPTVSDSTGNFALNNTAGGGALLKAAGFPGVAPFGTGYAPIGPLVPQASVGATGSLTEQ